MPIKGLTTDVRPAFPRLGILRKGGKKTNPNRPGPDLEYFRFVGADDEITSLFYKHYPAQPQELHIGFLGSQIDDVWEAWQEEWVAGGLKHRCDGETCVLWQDDNGEYHDTPKPCPGGCKPVGRLDVWLPELTREEGLVGTVTVLTSSKHDIMNIQSSLESVAELANGLGLSGIIYRLYRTPKKISTPRKQRDGSIKRVRAEKWLIEIGPSPQWVQLQQERQRKLQHSTDANLLTAPAFEPEEESLDQGAVIEALDGIEDPTSGGVTIDGATGEIIEDDAELEPQNGHWAEGSEAQINGWLDDKFGLSIELLEKIGRPVSKYAAKDEFIEDLTENGPKYAAKTFALEHEEELREAVRDDDIREQLAQEYQERQALL